MLYMTYLVSKDTLYLILLKSLKESRVNSNVRARLSPSKSKGVWRGVFYYVNLGHWNPCLFGEFLNSV